MICIKIKTLNIRIKIIQFCKKLSPLFILILWFQLACMDFNNKIVIFYNYTC